MSALTFDETTVAQHRTARFVFVPWLVRLFSEGPLRNDSSALPSGDPDALTEETVLAIQEVANRACWKFLVRECGWVKLNVVEPGDPDAHSIRRLWHNGGILPGLEFSTATPNLLIAMFNGSRRGERVSEITIPDCTKVNGDLLVHHLIFRRLRDVPKAFGLGPDAFPEQWYHNPLNAMYDPLVYRRFDASETSWSRLCGPDLWPFLPWIGNHQVGKWKADFEGLRALSVEHCLDWLEAMTFLITDLGREIESANRIDLATFLLDLMVHHHQERHSMLAMFEEFSRELSMRERQKLASRWVDFLALTGPLEESARKCHDVHPIERTGPQKCFLAGWEAIEFGRIIAGLREVSQSLRPSLG